MALLSLNYVVLAVDSKVLLMEEKELLIVNPDVVVGKENECFILIDTGNGYKYKLGEDEYNVWKAFSKESINMGSEIAFDKSQQETLINLFVENGLIIDSNRKKSCVKIEWISAFKIKLLRFRVNANPPKLMMELFNEASTVKIVASILGTVLLLLILYFINDYGLFTDSFVVTELGLKDLVIIYILYIATTVAHELSHALAYYRAIGYFPQIGLMFFLFAPVLYCDLTGIDLLKKNERTCVLKAGVWAQLYINSFIMIIMLVVLLLCKKASIVLLIFVSVNYVSALANLIPFVKLDGYWIIENKLGIKNLMERSMCELFRIKIMEDKEIHYKLMNYALLSITFHFVIWLITIVAIWKFFVNYSISGSIVIILVINMIIVIDLIRKIKQLNGSDLE